MLNERNKGNKKLKDAAMKEKGIKRKFSGRKTAIDGDHPHGTHGEERGVGREPARKVRSITMKGRTGTTATDTDEPRLVDRKGKRRKVATELLKNKSTTAGPVGKLPDHTVYHDMGYLMAESLGLISEKTRMAKEVQKKGPEHTFKTAGGENLRAGSLVRKASTEPGGSQHPRNNARDKYGRTGKERGKAAARLRQPGERTASVSDRRLARSLSTKGTNPSAREGTPGGDLQAKMRKKNFNPMATQMQRTETKAKKIAAERAEGKAGKRDK
jgi:hypothetical protein